MRAKSESSSPITLKLILITSFFLLLLIFIIRTTLSPSPPLDPSLSQLHKSDNNSTTAHDQQSHSCPPPDLLPLLTTPTCTKAPPSLANALIHYATTNITPQQTFKEISVSARVLERKSPCNFLVFGLGHDSLMWAGLNHGGRTVFLEEDNNWIHQITQKLPTLESYHVQYDTRVHQADQLMETGSKDEECRAVTDPRLSKCPLALKWFPGDVYDVEWDVIMVDAPTGYHEEAPGRMSAIYTAGLMARNREEGETEVFVHDVDRVIEDKFSKGFLCEGYRTEQEGRIRHFTVPSHRARSGRPFCP